MKRKMSAAAACAPLILASLFLCASCALAKPAKRRVTPRRSGYAGEEILTAERLANGPGIREFANG